MSRLLLFQIYDCVAMTVVGPIMAATRGEAIVRQFTEHLSNKESQLGKYPEDYALLEIGAQNQDTGELEPTDPKTIYTGRVWLHLQERRSAGTLDSSSPANTNGAGEQPPRVLPEQPDDTDRIRDQARRSIGGGGYHVNSG